MRLDHVSYVASHDQISDVVQRIGSQIGTAFVDGGIHPQFGTRNFTAPLLNGQYIEVVCALDHPAAEKTPFGQAVTKKAAEGGGWLTWVFSTDDLAPIERAIGRNAIEGHRRLPDGSELKWNQIGVKSLLEDPELPFFIEWKAGEHPSANGIPVATLTNLHFTNSNPIERSAFAPEIETSLLASSVAVELKQDLSGFTGLDLISFTVGKERITID
jgi:hypothetical protein